MNTKSTTTASYARALENTTVEEQSYMSNPTEKRGNRKWWIVGATVLTVALAAWYFYKH